MWNENDQCCEIHPDAKAKRTRTRECFEVAYQNGVKQEMTQALMDDPTTKKVENNK